MPIRLPYFITSFYHFLLLVLLAASISSCVTVTKGGFSDKASPDKAAENFTRLGLAYLQQGNVNRARDRLRKALEIRPKYPQAHDAMGLLWQREGELDYAEESFLSALKYDPAFHLARHHLGLLMSQVEKFDKAEALLLEVSKHRFYENRSQVFKDLAINAYKQKNPKKSVGYYRTSLRLVPYDATALVNVSTLLFQLNQYPEANKYFQRLQKMVSNQQTKHTAHSLWLGVRLFSLLNQPARARTLARQLQKNFPNSKESKDYKSSLKGVRL